jgi:F420-dependent oxidoreductase-like protein
MDHYFQIQGVGQVEDPMFEGYSALSFLASVTENARLGTMVTGIHYRHPGFLIKTVTGLDVLSGGRAYLGIGAGWFERESQGLGFPFPPLKVRFEQLEETLKIAKQMWAGDTSAINGKHYQLAEPINEPPAMSQPHPPILIGGSGEQKTLRLVAEYGDACNFFTHIGHDGLQHKLDVLKAHCDDVGRDYAEIEKTVLVPTPMYGAEVTPSKLIEACQAWAKLGISHAILSAVPNIDQIKPLELIGKEVIPALADV